MSIRVTQRSMSDSALRGLQGSLNRTQDLQEHLSSGRRVGRPGDDPSATAAAMKLREQRRADEQYKRNIEDSSGRINVTDQALTQLSNRLQRVRELALTARNGAMSPEGRSALAAEVEAIRLDVIDLYNTRWLDRPVFGGTTTGDIAVDATGTYVGDDAEVVSRISRDAVLRVDVRGSDIGANELPELITSIAAGIVGDDDQLISDVDVLKAVHNQILTVLGDLGARASRLDTTRANLESETLDFTSRISENEDADLPSTIMHLQAQQVAYQSALGAASKVLQVSLVDFLR